MSDDLTMSNPAVKKLSSFSSSVFGSQNVATYGGIGGKIGYFMALVLVGIVSFFVINAKSPGISLAVAVGATVVGLVGSLVAGFVPGTCPVSGAVYAVCEGYVLTWLSYSYAEEYKGIAIMALALTAIVVTVMAFLYSKRIVRASQKLRAVCLGGLIASLIGGVIYLLLAVFAPNSVVFKTITTMQFGTVGILFGVLGVVLAAVLLVFDFDTIAMTVENGLEKKYEWYAAYGLVVGIIYVYVKILNLLLRIFGSSKNNH